MTDHSKPDDESKNSAEQEINLNFDGNVGDAIGKGMEALQSVFGGFVDMVKETVGPEGMRNLEASQWLTQVASCMDGVAKGLREDGTVPAGKSGELSCFVDRIETEVHGSKFEAQLPALRERLEGVLATVQNAGAGDASVSVNEADINRVADASGYFSAAAASIAVSAAAQKGPSTSGKTQE